MLHSWLFIIRVKRELKREYRNGCRYNERLNAETDLKRLAHTGLRFIIAFFLDPFFFLQVQNPEKDEQKKRKGRRLFTRRSDGGCKWTQISHNQTWYPAILSQRACMAVDYSLRLCKINLRHTHSSIHSSLVHHTLNHVHPQPHLAGVLTTVYNTFLPRFVSRHYVGTRRRGSQRYYRN